ncbi:MAG: T9SS type A sorting domain-containing protein, partial [Flavobacteriales bacterium]|nr:T9SS type A sorting domain-containing protein [Flavobacteriales bacterium]
LAVENGVYLDLDFPIGSAIEIKVFDTLNPESEVVAGPIYISPYDWVEVTDALPFSARDGSGLLNFDNRLWLLGGWDPPNHPPHYTHSEVWTSTDGATWSYVLDAPWPARHCGGWIAGDDAMWVVGGDPQSNCLTDVWKSEDGTEWIQVLDAIPGYVPRHMANYAWFNNAIIMYGGEKCSLGGTSEVWTSSDGSSWEQLPDAPWSGRGMQLNYCVDDDGWLWMLGGSNEFSRRSYNEVWKTQNGIDWILVNDNAPWMGRYWHTVAWFDNKMWLLAGSATSLEQNDVWYSSDGVEWFEFKSGTGNWPAGSRHAQSTTVYNNALWYMCGINTNNVWKIVNTTATDIDTGISDQPSLSVYPNPGAGYFTVQLPGNFSGNVSVFDPTGMEILIVNPQSPVVDIDLSQYADGVYLLKYGWLPAIKLIKM